MELDRRRFLQGLGGSAFRVTGPDGSGEPDFSAWGQDRLWRVAAEIRRRIAL